MRNIILLLFLTTQVFAQEMRFYEDHPSQNDKNDIRYIVNTLSNNSMVNILFQKSSLEKAGDRIEHVHPLQFLLVVFSNEELKAGIHNIRNKGMVWKDFYCGLRDSLETESCLNNVGPHLHDFATKLGLKPHLISAAVAEKRWKDFLEILFANIPRNGDKNRYDD